MKAALQRLRAEMASDYAAFRDHVGRLSQLSLDADDPPEGDLARAAVALHHAYSAIEAWMERIARAVEGGLPEGRDWHQSLLEDMALEIDGVRPAVLSRESVELLRQLLGFRHFFRHAYAVALDGHQLAKLRGCARALEPRLAKEIERFDAFLKGLAERASS